MERTPLRQQRSPPSEPQDAELADVLDKMDNPDAVTLAQIKNAAGGGFLDWLQDHKNRRAIPHRMESCGYVPSQRETSYATYLPGRGRSPPSHRV